MYYFFLDEKLPPALPGRKKIVMVAWAVEQHRWGCQTATRFDFFKPPVLPRICTMLESLDAAAIAAEATLDASLYRSGEIDSTNDIPSMSRTNLIWSASATATLGTLVLHLLQYGREVGTIDIHFDPVSLTHPHSEAWQNLLRQVTVNMIKALVVERGLNSEALKKLRIRRVVSVPKPDHRGQMSDKFSMGTWVAHKLCSHFDEIEGLKCSRISSLDMSEGVRRSTQQFDGKSFDEP
jgi:hypothetical protein